MGDGDGRGPRDSSHKATVVEIRPPSTRLVTEVWSWGGLHPTRDSATKDTLASGLRIMQALDGSCVLSTNLVHI